MSVGCQEQRLDPPQVDSVSFNPIPILTKKSFAVAPPMIQGCHSTKSSLKKLWLTGFGELSPSNDGQPPADISVFTSDQKLS